METGQSGLNVLRGASASQDAASAVAELVQAIWQPDIKAVFVFASTLYDFTVLAAGLDAAFPGIPVVGCSGAGQIGPNGYLGHSIVGASIAGDDVWFDARMVDFSDEFYPDDLLATTLELQADAEVDGRELTPERCFALLFLDGTSAREELVLGALADALGALPLVGGSAGDDTNCGKTFLLCGGAVVQDGAVICLLHTRSPFHCFKHQNYALVRDPLVVTSADPGARVVHEFNGLPAVQEFARVHGLEVSDDPFAFISYPLAMQVGDELYLRGVLSTTPEGSIVFAAAIDVGVVVHPARPAAMDVSLEHALSEGFAVCGAPALTLGFDCIGRRAAMARAGMGKSVASIFEQCSTVGFGSHGEQFNAVQINMTLTGVMLGAGPRQAA